MGRYYVYVPPLNGGPYVLAELIREPFDDGEYRDTSLASAIAGPQSLVLTRDEMLEDQQRRQALACWLAGDDRSSLEYDEGVGHPRLRPVEIIPERDLGLLIERAQQAISNARRFKPEAARITARARMHRSQTRSAVSHTSISKEVSA